MERFVVLAASWFKSFQLIITRLAPEDLDKLELEIRVERKRRVETKHGIKIDS